MLGEEGGSERCGHCCCRGCCCCRVHRRAYSLCSCCGRRTLLLLLLLQKLTGVGVGDAGALLHHVAQLACSRDMGEGGGGVSCDMNCLSLCLSGIGLLLPQNATMPPRKKASPPAPQSDRGPPTGPTPIPGPHCGTTAAPTRGLEAALALPALHAGGLHVQRGAAH